MERKNGLKTPYTNSLLNVKKVGESSLNTYVKKSKIIKIKSGIIMCSTLIATFTILRPIMYLALIGSCIINFNEIYKLKKQLHNINEHKKTIIQINKFLNLEIELEKKNKIVGNIIEMFKLSMAPLIDLYDCLQTNNITILENITKKYEKKYEDNLNIINQINDSENKKEEIKPIGENSLSKSSHNYLLTDNSSSKGYQFVKKMI